MESEDFGHNKAIRIISIFEFILTVYSYLISEENILN